MTYIANCLEWKPWEKAHSVIATNPMMALFYVSNVLRGRLEQAEHHFEKNAQQAVSYAAAVGLRWKDMGKPEVELLIRQDPDASEQYARLVIKGRWEEAEEVIRSRSRSLGRYLTFLKSWK